MRIVLILALLMPSLVYASDWVALGNTAEARIMLDRESVATIGSDAKVSLKFVYHKQQPGQTISQGKPFDSTINEYYLVCSSQKYQVLQLLVFYKDQPVGSFHADLNIDNLDQAKLGTGVMFALNRICANEKPEK